MSITVILNGQSYIVPETGETGWGGNLDSFFVAIAAGCLQKTGGSFTLSAETDFGASYGLKALSYKSRSSNVAGTGVVRLANLLDAVSWRNAANNADLALKVDASDNLTFNGVPIVTGTSSTFTANRVIGSDSGGNLTALGAGSAGQVLASNGAGVAPTFQTVSGTGTVGSGTAGRLALYNVTSSAVADGYTQNSNTINVVITAHGSLASTRTYTIPDAGNNADFVMTAGAQTVAGAKTFSSAVTLSAVPVFTSGLGSTFLGSAGTQGILEFYPPTSGRGKGRLLISDSTGADSTVTLQIEGNDAGGNPTVVIPARSGTLVGTTGVQTISGTKTFNSLALGGDITGGGHGGFGFAPGTITGALVTYEQITPLAATLTGEVKMWPTASAPTGYLFCDGTSYLRATYPDLFAVIGTTWGAVDGTHFTVPDMRSRVPIGVGTGSGLTARALATNYGAETTTVPAFSTELENVGSPGTGSAGTQIVSSNTGGNGLFSSTGGGDTLQQKGFHTQTVAAVTPAIIPPSVGINFIIKT